MLERGKRSAVPLVLLVLALVFVWSCGDDAGEGQKQDGASADSTAVDSTKVDSTAADSAKKAEKKKVPEGVPVKVAPVEQEAISSYLLFSATLEAEETVDVYARSTGIVCGVLAEEGDKVVTGQVLVELVDDELRLAEADARVDYEKQSSQFDRKEEIFSRKLIAKEAYEEVRYNFEQAKIRWQRAKLNLDHASVKSPTDGVVAERMVKLGDRIGPNGKLYTLVKMEYLIARVHVPGREMRTLAVGQPARVTTDFLPDTAFVGSIIRVSPVVDPGSGTFKVTLGIKNLDGSLRPGMFVNTHIVTATHSDAVVVPKRAVVYDDGMPHVFVVKDSTAHRIRLEVGFEDADNFEVVSGIDRGEQIVVVGQNGLKDQAKVRIIEGEGLRIPSEPDSTKQKEAS